MVFSSLAFLYAFLPITLLLYFIVPLRESNAAFARKWRNGVLLLASLVFYAWGEPRLVLMMLLATVIAYGGGLAMDSVSANPAKSGAKKTIFVITVVLLAANLFVFKYFNFAVNNFAKLFRFTPSVAQIALPIGISFYTFQILSYVIDLYRGEIAVQKSFARLLLYVCLFPQLIAGPIVRYQTVETELTERRETIDDSYAGAVRFVAGLGKKVLLANNLAIIAESIYAGDTAIFGSGAYWLAAVAYSLQIYFDFSGYSDMAIGIGRILGFHFEENFNRPYLSTGVTEFWRRWHISLSSWFRDYVYIPLGGNRVSAGRRIFNILAVWALTGLWHGAEWNFVLWGLYYGVLLIAEKTIDDAVGKTDCAAIKILRWIITMFIVVVGWVLFNRNGSGQLAQTLGVMFSAAPTRWLDGFRVNSELLYGIVWLPAALLTVVFERGGVCKRSKKDAGTEGSGTDSEGITKDLLVMIRSIIVLVLCLMLLLNSSYNPFIYFRF